MRIPLNDTQKTRIAQRQSQIRSQEMELNHSKDKLNDFIVGIATARGVIGDFTWTIKEDALEIELPEPTPAIEE